MIFVLKASSHFFDVTDIVNKTIYISQHFFPISVPNHFFKGADGYNLSHFWSIFVANFIQICPSANFYLCSKNFLVQVVPIFHL